MHEEPNERLERLATDLDIVARHLTRDETTRADLVQEMACHLLTLPPGQTRAWYLSRAGDYAKKFLQRRVIDAPLDRRGRPDLTRRTVCVGGLHELDRLHQRRRAA
jgi:DNA-directed RNA polymerase specialized sigma24 family protein